MTRIQKERFSDPIEYERVKNSYVLRNSMLETAKPNMRILHPLPRVNEITVDVDDNPQAYYFNQALNGVYVRQALLASILGVK
jgi:aspartate carbamoyltransferase catalytic subunit